MGNCSLGMIPVLFANECDDVDEGETITVSIDGEKSIGTGISFVTDFV
jgi:hypothetical protein